MSDQETIQTSPAPALPDAVFTEAERTVLGLIRALQAGELKGPALSTSDRRRVIEHLWAEGYSVPETAEVLKVSERTIQRDRKAIREANAVERTPALVSETVGGLVRQAEAVVGRLRRISRDRETAPPSRIEAEKGVWTVSRELVQTLQSLGYLPTAAQEVRADVTHNVGPGLDQMRIEVEQLDVLLAEVGVDDPGLRNQLGLAKQELERLSLASKVQQITVAAKEESHGSQ